MRTRPSSPISALRCAGEILGFYGLVGAGRSASSCRRCSASPGPPRGPVRIDGKVAVIRVPADAVGHGHRLCAGRPGQAGRDQGDCRSSRTSRCPRSAAPREERVPAAGRGIHAGARIHRGWICAPPRSTGRRKACRAATSRRWSSPSGWRPAQGHHPRRTHQGHRHRLQGRGARIHGRTCRRAWRHHGVLRNPRGPRHVGPGHRHARGPDRGRIRRRGPDTGTSGAPAAGITEVRHDLKRCCSSRAK
jgi:hypothetical protein